MVPDLFVIPCLPVKFPVCRPYNIDLSSGVNFGMCSSIQSVQKQCIISTSLREYYGIPWQNMAIHDDVRFLAMIRKQVVLLIFSTKNILFLLLFNNLSCVFHTLCDRVVLKRVLQLQGGNGICICCVSCQYCEAVLNFRDF